MEEVTKFLISFHINDGRWKGVFNRHCEENQKKHQLTVTYKECLGAEEQLLGEGEFTSYDVVLLIISKDYLSLGMVENGNLEKSILNFEHNGTKVVLVHAEHCEWQRHKWIKIRGLRPSQSNALSDDWDYPKRLNRLVSDLIRDVMAEKRETDSNNLSNEPPRRKPDESEAEKKKTKKKKVSGGGPYGGNEENESDRIKLQNVFIEFLQEEKGYSKECFEEIIKEGREIDLCVTDDKNSKPIAIFEFKPSNDMKSLFRATRQLISFCNEGILGKPDPFKYIVCPAEGKSRYVFDTHEVFDDKQPPLKIDCEDFPTYNQMLFASPLSAAGRRLCRSLVELAKDKHGLSINATCKDYINLQINKRTAAQIHRLNDSDKNIALVLAGYQEVFPDSESESYMVRGEISQLSGNTKERPKEMAWLNGNVNHERLRYRAGVYIIQPGSLVLEDVENEVGELLDLARKNAEGDKKPVHGNIVTAVGDRPSAEDLLGRDGLVNALAKMFVHNEDIEGFTVALLGDWGEGKSTVMRLLEKNLKEKHKRKFVFATFNAWEYEHTDNIAAGIAQEIVKGLTDEIGEWGKILLRFKFAWREHNEKLRGLVIIILLALNISIISLDIALLFNEIPSWYKIIPAFFGLSAIGLPLISFKDLKKIFEHPLSTQLQTYLKLPNYGEHLGLVPVLKRHLEILCDLILKGESKLIVFVDDLDRCQTDCITKTLDAIRLVMTISNVIVMIGIDHRIAFKAVENSYKILGNRERTEADIARDYLGKIIQLPIRLIPVSSRDLRKYVNDRLYPNAIQVTRKDRSQPISIGGSDGTKLSTIQKVVPSTQKQIKEDDDEIMCETTDERDRFYNLANRFRFTNPRQLLRLRNSYRLLKALNETAEFEWESLMSMLFWQEFLHNWPMKVRGGCMSALIDDTQVEEITPEARKVFKKVKSDISTLFNNEPTRYEQMAKFVRVVVLPHNEEGIVDTKEEIDEWLKKKAKEKEGEDSAKK